MKDFFEPTCGRTPRVVNQTNLYFGSFDFFTDNRINTTSSNVFFPREAARDLVYIDLLCIDSWTLAESEH